MYVISIKLKNINTWYYLMLIEPIIENQFINSIKLPDSREMIMTASINEATIFDSVIDAKNTFDLVLKEAKSFIHDNIDSLSEFYDLDTAGIRKINFRTEEKLKILEEKNE